jgi:hypothetical protein
MSIQKRTVNNVDYFIASLTDWELSDWHHFKPYITDATQYDVYTVCDENQVVCFGIVGHYPDGFVDYYNSDVFPQFHYCLEWMQTKDNCRKSGYASLLLKELRKQYHRFICLSGNEYLLFYYKRGGFPIVGENSSLNEGFNSYICFHENDDLNFEEAKEIYGELLEYHEQDYKDARAVQKGVPV